MNREPSDIQARFRKDRGPRAQTADICRIREKAREFQATSTCLIELAEAFDCVDHNKLWKTLKEAGIRDHFACLLRDLYAGQ